MTVLLLLTAMYLDICTVYTQDPNRVISCAGLLYKGRAYDPHILAALAWSESRFDPLAEGDGGNSLGLLQVNLRYVQCTKSLYRNGKCDLVADGLRFLNQLTRRFNSRLEQIAYYKGGKKRNYKGARKVLQWARKTR